MRNNYVIRLSSFELNCKDGASMTSSAYIQLETKHHEWAVASRATEMAKRLGRFKTQI